MRLRCDLMLLAVKARGIGFPEAGSCKLPLKGMLGTQIQVLCKHNTLLLPAETSLQSTVWFLRCLKLEVLK